MPDPQHALKPVKLTKPQKDFLYECAKEPRSAYDSWPPARKLVELGFIRHVSGKYGGGQFHITTAGRDWVNA